MIYKLDFATKPHISDSPTPMQKYPGSMDYKAMRSEHGKSGEENLEEQEEKEQISRPARVFEIAHTQIKGVQIVGLPAKSQDIIQEKRQKTGRDEVQQQIAPIRTQTGRERTECGQGSRCNAGSEQVSRTLLARLREENNTLKDQLRTRDKFLLRLATANSAQKVALEEKVSEQNATIQHLNQEIIDLEQVVTKLSALKILVIRKGIREIQKDQFMDNGVEKIIIPESVQEIGKEAFAGWKCLQEVEFLGAPSKIATGAFRNCPKLVAVKVPSGEMHLEQRQGDWTASLCVPIRVREVSFHPAYEHFGLREVIFEICSGVRVIGDRAFLNCEQLQKITVKEIHSTATNDLSSLICLKKIGAMAFFGCCDLGNIVLPGNITLGHLCFWGTQVTNDRLWMLPQKNTLTPAQLGMSYQKVREVALPEVVDRVEKFWFYGSGVEKVTVPANVQEIEDEAFIGMATLQQVVFASDSKLERIGDFAFAKSGLRTFEGPDLLVELGEQAFYHCKNLASVKFQNRLRRIGGSCFEGSPLEHVTIYQTVNYIGEHAFATSSGRTPLVFQKPEGETSQILNIPEDLEEVRAGQFQGYDVAEVRVPMGVKRIGSSAFRDWKCLRKVTFADGSQLDEIGDEAFAGSGLVEFIAPERLKCIKALAFCNCKSLRYISFNDALVQVSAGTCPNLREVRLSSGVISITCDKKTNKFSGVLTVFWDTRKIELHPAYEYFGLWKIVFEESCQLEHIGRMAFYSTKLKSFSAPDSLRRIDELAFGHCSELKDVQLNNRIRAIGNFCFLGTKVKEIQQAQNCVVQREALGTGYDMNKVFILQCGFEVLTQKQVPNRSIRIVVIPQTIKKIDDYTFYSRSDLRQIIFPDQSQLEEIGEGAFEESGLQKFSAPRQLRKVGPLAFMNCNSLRSIKLNNELQEIGNFCFPDIFRVEGKLPPHIGNPTQRSFSYDQQTTLVLQQGLETITKTQLQNNNIRAVIIPPSATVLENCAFEESRGLQQLFFRSGSQLQRIGDYCFSGTELKQIVTPPSLREIGDFAFYSCKILQHVILNEGLGKLGSHCFDSSGVVSISLPKTLRKLETSTFQSCDQLTTVTLPEELEEIGQSCFSRSGITELLIPKHVKIIREGAFYCCEHFQKCTFEDGSALENIEKHSFGGTNIHADSLPIKIEDSQRIFSV